MDLLRLLELNAYEVYRNCLIGNSAPRIAKLLTRFTHPQEGDLVLETTTLWSAAHNGLRLGRLKRHVKEPVQYEEGAEPFLEECWYIELLDGQEFRWHNAHFIVVAESLELLG